MNQKTLLIYTIAALAATGGLLFGYDTGVINVALELLKKQWVISSTQEGWIVGAVLAGGMAGSLLSGQISDVLGRKRINIVASGIFVGGSIVTAVAQGPEVLIAGRLLLGLAIGIVSFSVPLYISEISPSDIRGRLVTFFQLAITIGILVSYFCGYYFAESVEGWRSMFWAGFVPAIILFVGMLFVPESPRWLISKGRDDEAKRVLERIHAHDQVAAEYAAIKHGIEQERGHRTSWTELFGPRLRIPFLIGVGIFMFQQFSGINAVIYYSTSIFAMAGMAQGTSNVLATVGVGVVNVAFTFLSLRIIDRWGRKPLLYMGLLGCGAALASLGLSFYFRDSLGSASGWLAIGSVYVYIAFFALTLGPLGWLLISEVYPLRIRGFAASMGSFYHWFFDLCVAVSFPILREIPALGTGGGIFFIYFGIVMLGLFFAKYIVFETKGLSLEQIEERFSAQ